jgi:hypothetical protein
MTNGSRAHHAPKQPEQPTHGFGGSSAIDADTPLAVVNAITVTPALVISMVKWISGAVVAVVTILTAANGLDRYMMPARDSEFQALRSAFEKEQTESRVALQTLTAAVNNLSGIVDRIANTPQQMQRLAPKAAAGRTPR